MISVSTHSHPKVAATNQSNVDIASSFNTQPPEGGCTWIALCRAFLAEFQHTATRRWLHGVIRWFSWSSRFNTQPPEGGCLLDKISAAILKLFQHTATRRWLPCTQGRRLFVFDVSTHSHPKVAAKCALNLTRQNARFNTQPPEGGCNSKIKDDWI